MSKGLGNASNACLCTAAMHLPLPTSGMKSSNCFFLCQLKRPTCTGGRGGEAQGLADLNIILVAG